MNKSHMSKLRKLLVEIAELPSEEREYLRDKLSPQPHRSGKKKYVGSSTRNKFHETSCKYAACIPNKKLIIWQSHEEAVRAGRKPCGTCCA